MHALGLIVHVLKLYYKRYLVLLEGKGDVEDDGSLGLQQLILSPGNNTEWRM